MTKCKGIQPQLSGVLDISINSVKLIFDQRDVPYWQRKTYMNHNNRYCQCINKPLWFCMIFSKILTFNNCINSYAKEKGSKKKKHHKIYSKHRFQYIWPMSINFNRYLHLHLQISISWNSLIFKTHCNSF